MAFPLDLRSVGYCRMYGALSYFALPALSVSVSLFISSGSHTRDISAQSRVLNYPSTETWVDLTNWQFTCSLFLQTVHNMHPYTLLFHHGLLLASYEPVF